jgi:Ca2+-binding RTX toxin-like protein
VAGTLSTAEPQDNTNLDAEGLMGLLSGFNIALLEIEMLGQAARAAFSEAAIPNGWSVLTPQQLGVAPRYWDGLYFTNNGASAIVLQQGNAIVVSFRGTDSEGDFAYYPELLFGTYINRFQPLLTAIAAEAPGDAHFYFTGTSLGGGAVNQMADIASDEYAGRFAAAQFVAFDSPTIVNANGILNFGFENDPIYKVLENYSDQPSSLDNLILATAEYMAGDYDGRHPPNYYAHSSSAFDVIGRLKDSAFYDFMSPDSVLIFDAYSGPVTDVTPGRESTGAFYLGEAVADRIIGRAGDDFIEGFAGDDILSGAAGNDRLDGGAGNDIMVGGTGNDIYTVDSLSDVIIENANEGTDAVIVFANNYTVASNVENGNAGLATGQWLTGNGLGNTLFGNIGDDILDGGGGLDWLTGGPGNDIYLVDNLGDTANENPGADIDTAVASVDFTIPTNVEVLCENGIGLTGTGSAANDILVSVGGPNTLVGLDGGDTFVCVKGQSDGTTIQDFNGNGPDAGDTLVFVGYGTAAQGATLTQTDPTHWNINSSDGLAHDIITLANGAAVHQSDFLFV